VDFKGAQKYILDRLETELSPDLLYHGIHHTIDVYEVSIKISEIEKISEEDKIIVITSALYHDAGFIYRYLNNEELAVDLIREELPRFGYNEKQIKFIADIILNTRIRARPITKLQQIMSDADYDYLGRSDVGKIAHTLFEELNRFGFNLTIEEWNVLQIKFLKKHEYHTASSLETRRPSKLAYYEYLKSL
jgi:HD superfamily phosphodiesterase